MSLFLFFKGLNSSVNLVTGAILFYNNIFLLRS